MLIGQLYAITLNSIFFVLNNFIDSLVENKSTRAKKVLMFVFYYSTVVFAKIVTMTE